MKVKLITIFIFISLLILPNVFLIRMLKLSVAAQGSTSKTPPNFPTCSERVFTQDGDRAHYESGSHEIPGMGRMDGSDDVYTLDFGNFLQCYCPVDGEVGIQSNWWNIGNAGLAYTEIEDLKTQGWMYVEDGLIWNLLEEPYLVVNSNFDCTQTLPSPTPTAQPTATVSPVSTSTPSPTLTLMPTPTSSLTPTPTISPSPTVTPQTTLTPTPTATLTPTSTITPTPTATMTPTPTATSTPGPTSTPGQSNESHCVGLSASPSEGSTPLTVVFTGSGFDKNGDILEYEFDFGDSTGFQPQVWRTKDSTAAHRYENAGLFVASLRVKDQAGIWRDGNDDCKVTITVNSTPKVLGATTPNKLPETGIPAVASTALVLSGTLGSYLYKRFRLI